MLPDEPTEEERREELPEDYQTPFTPADDSSSSGQGLDDTHPATDTNIDAQEAYDEGLSGAAEAEEPNHGNAVIDFDKKANPEDSL